MNFLSKYGAIIDCKAKVVNFQPPGEEQFTFNGDKNNSQKMFVSAMKARKWLDSGCTSYLAAVVDTTKKIKVELNNVPVVNEFVDVFPEELPGLPLYEKLLSRSKCCQELLQSRRRPIVWPRQN